MGDQRRRKTKARVLRKVEVVVKRLAFRRNRCMLRPFTAFGMGPQPVKHNTKPVNKKLWLSRMLLI
jgi:hypothetical protein